MRVRACLTLGCAVLLVGCGAGEVEPSSFPAADGVTAPASEGGGEADRVVAVVQSLLDGITGADTSLVASAIRRDALVVAVRGDGNAPSSSGADLIRGVSDPQQGYVERMWSPTVRVDGPVATVWAPYDFYVHGEFSHCGVDTFQLVRQDGDWTIRSLVYTVRQPPQCTLHPDGPPPG